MGTSNADVDVETSGRGARQVSELATRSPSGSPLNHQTMSNKEKRKKKDYLQFQTLVLI